METKQERLERQYKAHKKHLREMKKSVKEMWARKVLIDSRHFNYEDVVVS